MSAGTPDRPDRSFSTAYGSPPIVALDAASPDADRLCVMAKVLATEAGSAVTDRALQLHRGAADSGDGGIDQIARDLELHRTLEGSNDLLRVLVARTLTGAG
jgi:alkylation response protein AidB-like acyl-CoA dehydrogenase